MCYGISRRFSFCNFARKLDFAYEVIVDVNLLGAVAAGFAEGVNHDFFHELMENIGR